MKNFDVILLEDDNSIKEKILLVLEEIQKEEEVIFNIRTSSTLIEFTTGESLTEKNQKKGKSNKILLL